MRRMGQRDKEDIREDEEEQDRYTVPNTRTRNRTSKLGSLKELSV